MPSSLRRLTRRAAAALGVLSAVCAIPARAQHPDTLTLGTYTYSTNDRLANIAPLGRHLAERLGRPVRVVSLPDVPGLVQAVTAGTVDIAVINTFGYLLLAADSNARAEPVAALEIAPGESSNYRSVIVARNTGPRTPDALAAAAKGLRIAFVASGSTSGNLVPRLYLASLGLADPEARFRAVSYAGTHAAALEQVRRGTVDVAALASEEYDRVLAQDPAAARELALAWTSEEIPLGPVVVRTALPRALRESIAAELVRLAESAPAALAAVRDGWVEARHANRFVPVTDRSYDAMRRMFGDPRTAAGIIARFVR